jgi:2-C-methyl-D-erythritol 4-phosphate cytidylyltransferase
MPEVIGVVVVAGGGSRRMAGVDKLWLPVAGRPLLEHTLLALVALPELTRVVLVVSPDGRRRVAERRASAASAASAPWDALHAVVDGGAERADSVYAGLRALGACDLVLIHDGARPLVTPELVRAGLTAARRHGAAVPALPVTDTIKRVDEAGRIVATPDRAALRAVQTPQVFRHDLLLAAYEAAGAERAASTDDATLLEQGGHPVYTYPGDPRNIKVSTPADLPLVSLYLTESMVDSR